MRITNNIYKVRFLILVIGISLACEKSDHQVSGVILNEYDKPIPGVTVEFYNLEDSIKTDIEYFITDSTGLYKGDLNKIITNQFVSKIGYMDTLIEALLINFKNDTIMLRNRMRSDRITIEDIDFNYLSEISDKNILKHKILDIFTMPYNNRKGGIIEQFFLMGDILYPVFKETLTDTNDDVSYVSEFMIRLMAKPEDYEIVNIKPITENIEANHLDEVIKLAFSTIIELDKNARFSKSKPVTNNNDRAYVSCSLYNGPLAAQGFIMCFKKIGDIWRFIYYFPTWVS